MIAQPGTGRRRFMRRTRLIAIAASAMVAMLGLAGCAAGQIAGTAQEVSADDGASGDVGSIHLRNVAVVAPTDNSYPKGGDAALQFYIVNGSNKTDHLVGVTTSAAGSVSFYPSGATASVASAGGLQAAGGASSALGSSSPTGSGAAASGTVSSIALPPGQHVAIGYKPTDHAVVMHDLAAQLWPAQSITITFKFGDAGSVSFPVPVQLAKLPASPATAPIDVDSTEG